MVARSSELLLPLGHALYLRPRWPSRVAIAAQLRTSPGALNPWVQYLTFHRAVREADHGLAADPDRLLQVLTAHRVANLRPEAPLRIAMDAREAHALFEARGVPHSLAMFSAANEWAFFEPRRDVQLYVPRAALPQLRRVLASVPARGAGQGLLQAFAEDLDRLEVQRRGGLPVTSPFQTVLDLRAHPEGGAHAAFLQEKLLPRLQGPVA